MPRVSDLITHILHHVNAEDSTRDPSQRTGVAARAQLVRDAVQGFRNDTRDISIRDILQAIYDAIPTRAGRVSFRRAIENMRSKGGTRPQLAIQTWVGKARETR